MAVTIPWHSVAIQTDNTGHKQLTTLLVTDNPNITRSHDEGCCYGLNDDFSDWIPLQDCSFSFVLMLSVYVPGFFHGGFLDVSVKI